MSAHKFSIGESVSYRSHQRIIAAAPGRYTVVRVRPIERGEPAYLIRNDIEKFERTALESELSAPNS